MSVKDVAFLPQCDTKGCTTHAPIQDNGRVWCCNCWMQEKNNDEDRRQHKKIPEDSGAYAKRRTTKMCGEV